MFLATFEAALSRSNEISCPLDESFSKIFLVWPPLPKVQSRYIPSVSEIKKFTDSSRSIGICLILYTPYNIIYINNI